MATGISPLGNGSPSLPLWGEKFPVPANAHEGAFSPVPAGEFIPLGNLVGNLSLLEVQRLTNKIENYKRHLL
jgi:hypothetical protein